MKNDNDLNQKKKNKSKKKKTPPSPSKLIVPVSRFISTKIKKKPFDMI